MNAGWVSCMANGGEPAAHKREEEWQWWRSINGCEFTNIVKSSLFVHSSLNSHLHCVFGGASVFRPSHWKRKPLRKGHTLELWEKERCLWFWKMNFYLFVCKIDSDIGNRPANIGRKKKKKKCRLLRIVPSVRMCRTHHKVKLKMWNFSINYGRRNDKWFCRCRSFFCVRLRFFFCGGCRRAKNVVASSVGNERAQTTDETNEQRWRKRKKRTRNE